MMDQQQIALRNEGRVFLISSLASLVALSLRFYLSGSSLVEDFSGTHTSFSSIASLPGTETNQLHVSVLL